jgi:mono/diheme cytochrome c family protein/glucose/arabinose dehydrogenase
MTVGKATLVALVIGASTVAARGDQNTTAWPPPFHMVSGGSPVLSPDEEMKTFFLPPGYHVELVASEPMIEDPIFIDWDARGRMWVIELLGYMPDLRASKEREPVGRISVLEDRNGDGKMDTKTVFLDHLILPRALKVLEGGVLVAEPPHLWFARDTNGDLKADSKELVCDCYGFEMGNVEHNANGLVWGLDNWIYTSESGTFLRLKDGKFDVRQTLMRGQWGVSQDDAGYVYRNISPEALHVDVVPTHYFFRNPNLIRTRGSDEPLGGAELNTTFPVRPNRGVNRGYTPGELRADGSLARYTAAGAPTVYRGDRLPAELYGNVFVAEPAGNLVSRIILTDDGGAFRGRKAYDKAEFLASTDERFRPVNLSAAPDGTLYVVDMYHGIIQHMGYMTEYLRGNIVERELEAPVHKGRIFRIVHDTTRRGPDPSLATESAAQLVDRFSHPNGWWRDTAQRILVERRDKSIVPVLNRLADTAAVRARLHALWTLDGLDSLDPSLVIKALNDSSRDVRVSATRLAERWLSEPNHPVQAAVIKKIDDPNWAVRPQVAASLAALPSGKRETVLASVLDRHGDDPLVVDAALSGLRGSEGVVLEKMLESGAQTPARHAAIVMLTATVIRAREDNAIQSIFQGIIEGARPAWQRSALMRGAEVALLGAPMPDVTMGAAPARGTLAAAPGRGAGAAGDRGSGGAGAGGRGGTAPAVSAPAFPGTRPRDPNGRPEPTGTLRLRQQPVLVGFAASDTSGLGSRAALVLERIEWPGKPGAVMEAPLTAEESARFDAGRRVYTNICQVCHQQDGRGQDKVAPKLVGSTLALARAEVTARILLNGKEGTIGLMPAVGAVLSDDEVAAVLTYIRREWGQTGSPVDPATVKNVRAQTADRRTPWTNAELLALNEGGAGRRQ